MLMKPNRTIIVVCIIGPSESKLPFHIPNPRSDECEPFEQLKCLLDD